MSLEDAFSGKTVLYEWYGINHSTTTTIIKYNTHC